LSELPTFQNKAPKMPARVVAVLLVVVLYVCDKSQALRWSRSSSSSSSLTQRLFASAIEGNSDNSGALQNTDAEVWGIIDNEWNRQFRGIELIASENFCSQAVMEALGSCMTNKYSEGLPGARYYGGNVNIDRMEILCQERALKLFRLGN
jgi:hypothetical protein